MMRKETQMNHQRQVKTSKTETSRVKASRTEINNTATSTIKQPLTLLLAWLMVFSLVPIAAYTTVAQAEPLPPIDSPYVVVSVEKFTLGQGYLVTPTIIQLYPGDTAADVIGRALGDDNYRYTGSASTLYVSSICDSDAAQPTPPAYITDVTGPLSDRAREGWLGEFDFTNLSGWMYLVNGELVSSGLGQKTVSDGDVIRLCFTLYGRGADFTWLDSNIWGFSPLQESYANLDSATKTLAQFNAQTDHGALLTIPRVRVPYEALISAVTDLTSSQATVDAAIIRFNDSLEPVDKTDLDAKIAEAQAITGPEGYSNLSWQAFAAALANAQANSIDILATAKEVSSALADLSSAISKLEVLSTDPVDFNGNVVLQAAVTRSLGKPEGYSGDIAKGELNEFTGVLDVSNTGMSDADLFAYIKEVRNASKIDLSDNPALTNAVMLGSVYDWTSPKELDFTACTGITAVAQYAFGVGNSLTANTFRVTTICLPNSLVSVGNYAFSYNPYLRNVCFEAGGVGSISFGTYVFQYSQVETITMPTKPYSLGNYCFRNTQISAIDICRATSLGTALFMECLRITSTYTIVLPDGISTLPNALFSGCTSLVSISLPESLKELPQSMFEGCSSLTIIDLREYESLTTLGSYAFRNCVNASDILLPPTITRLSNSCFAGTAISHIDLSHVTQLGDSILNGCTNVVDMGDINLADSITELPFGFYSNCALTEIKLPEQIKTLGGSVFAGNYSITQADFSALDFSSISTTTAGIDVSGTGICSYNDILFPEGYSHSIIPHRFFMGCPNITTLDFPGTITTIGSYSYYASGLVTAYIPDNVTLVGASAFSSCENLLYAKFPEDFNLTNTGFSGCRNLLVVDMPKTTSSTILPNSFLSNTAVSSLQLPSSIIQIGSGSFNGSRIRSIDMTGFTGGIGSQAFANTPIEYAELPLTATTVSPAASAFLGCSNLKYVSVPANATSFGMNAFGGGLGLVVLDMRAAKSFPTATLDNRTTLATSMSANLPTSVLMLRPPRQESTMDTRIGLVDGEEYQVQHTIPSSEVITWGSVDPTIASVSADGVITAVSPGVTFIYAHTEMDAVSNCDYNGVVRVDVSLSGTSNDLYSLNTAGITLGTDFIPSITSYLATAKDGAKTQFISALPLDPRASLAINGSVVTSGALVDVTGLENITITVTDIDNNPKDYTIKVYQNTATVNPVLYGLLPAPGQFINTGVYAGVGVTQYEDLGRLTSLGDFGGYITLYFLEAVTNDPSHPYGVDFTLYGNPINLGGFEEPGGVMVAQDKDGDGQPDQWFTLAGSEHYNDTTIWDYQRTYYPDRSWTDSLGDQGATTSAVFPSSTAYPLQSFNSESITYIGTIITRSLSDYNSMLPMSNSFGYVDVYPGRSSLPANPYANSQLGDPMDISWAVDANGLPVYLDEVSFVRVYTATSVDAGAIGEKSTEFADIQLVSGTQNASQTPDISSITLDFAGGSYQVPLESGKYVYDLSDANIPADAVSVSVNTSAENVYVNSQKLPANTASRLITLSPALNDRKIIRVIAQTGYSEPVTYYLDVTEAAGTTTVGAPGSGDLNGDGIVDMSEALTTAQVVVGGGMALSPAQFAALDMDNDGNLTMADVVLIMRKAAGL
jgi:hypothetical protein